MASRKEQKQTLKAQRLEREAARQAATRRRRRIQTLGGALTFAAILVVVLIVVSQAGDGGSAGDIKGRAEVAKELGGIAQDKLALGDPKAEVTITEFGDLQCPFCKKFSDSELPSLIERQVRPGKARIEFLNFVILGPDSDLAARAALAASKQDRYWQFLELFYRNQGMENTGYVTDEFLESIAAAAELDIKRWRKDRSDPAWQREITRVSNLARRRGVNSTPSFVVEGPDGETTMPEGNTTDMIEAAIDRVR